MSIPIVQNGAFSCMCFDEYRTSNRAPCVNGCTQMVNYLAVHSPLVLLPCNDPATGSINLPGEPPNSMLELFSSETGKRFVHSLFEGVWSVVKEDRYLSDITEGNIYFSREGNVRFHNVVIMDQGTQGQREAKARRNYHQVCRIAVRKFRDAATALGRPGIIPCDIDDLFNRVIADKVLYNIGLYHIHFSLVPIGVGLLAFIKMHEHLMTTINPIARDKILDNLHGCPEFIKDANGTANWITEACNNSLLLDVYNFNQISYIVDDKNIARKLGIAIHYVRMAKRNSQLRHEYTNMVKRTEVAVFLDFLRNRTAHRMQSWAVGTLEYFSEEADYGCLLRFRLFLTKVQWELWTAQNVDFARINFSDFF